MSVCLYVVECQLNVNDAVNHNCLFLGLNACIYKPVCCADFGAAELSNTHTKFSFHLIAAHQIPNFGSQSTV